MTFRSPPRWPRKPAKPNTAAENRRFFAELCGRSDGSIAREDTTTAADRALYDELCGRIDGSIRRDEQEDEWADIVAGVREAHRRLLGMAR